LGCWQEFSVSPNKPENGKKENLVLEDNSTFYCKRRMGHPMESEQPDRWDRRGEDLCCSYCGSMHPQTIIDLAYGIVDGGDTQTFFHMSDKAYKMYVDRKNIQNASEGGIKFYSAHIPEGDEGKSFLELTNKALRISHEKWEKDYEERMQRIMKGE
jgi:hypothetical protein